MIKFHVIVRARNCEKYIQPCVNGLLYQKYKNWDAYISLDSPEDKTAQMLRIYKDFRIKYGINDKPLGLTHNLVHAVREAEKSNFNDWDGEDVIVIVDGDDFIHGGALRSIAKIYHKHCKTLLTYGSYIKLSKGRKTKISRPYPGNVDVRNYKWRASHLKTFKVKLWKYFIRHYKNHLKDSRGVYYPAASDVAIMIPMMELAGWERCRHCSKLIYYWRDNTNHKTKRDLQKKCEKMIRAKRPLKKIDI